MSRLCLESSTAAARESTLAAIGWTTSPARAR